MSFGAAFWDSSALTPCCVQEQTSAHATALMRQSVPWVWWAARVEIHSAIARLQRSGRLNPANTLLAQNRLERLQSKWNEVPPGESIREDAQALLNAYDLRAADSLQLAAALAWCQQKPARRTFICADIRLSNAASQAGFSVVTL